MHRIGTGSSGTAQADELLAEGFPLEVTAEAATRYIERCRDVLESLGESASLPAVKLLTASVVAASQTVGETGIDEAHRALELAGMLEDEVARAYALVAHCVINATPDHNTERVEAAQEVLRIATEHAEPTLVQLGYLILLVALLERGEIRALDTQLLEAQAAAVDPDGTRGVDITLRYQCLRSILDGDTDLAERQAEAIFARANKDGTDAVALYTTQIGMIRWMQGRVDGAEERLLEARRRHPEQLLWPASLAWLWLLQGRYTSAEALLASLPDLEDIPRDQYWLATITVLAEIAIIHGPRSRAAHLHAMLAPHSHRLVPVGTGVGFWGTAARTVGLLEERLGMIDSARKHLEMAVQLSGRIGALAWLAEAQIELAEFALRHDMVDIASYELLAEAKATSRARGFAALERRAMYRPRIRVLGRFEVVSLEGTPARWTSRKARELLKMLVAARGVATSREVFMDVLWPDEDPGVLGNRFSVAVTVIRRSFDPERRLPTQHHLVTEGDSLRLDLDHLDIDLERFLTLAERSDETSRRAARALYVGEAFSDEPYASWPVLVRNHAARLREELG